MIPRSPATHKGRTLGRAVAATCAVGVALLGLPASPASAAVTPLVSESFSGASATAGTWVLPAASTNKACLTAGTNPSALPIKGCNLPTPDPAGSGVLRLTQASDLQVGTAYYTTAVPLNQGLRFTFDAYLWGGDGVDGLSFILTSTDPANPSQPASQGGAGYGLGYMKSDVGNGVPNGYLGFGLDSLGSYSSAVPAGCSSVTTSGAAYAIRGPGNLANGFCLVDKAPVTPGRLNNPGSATRPAPMPVEVALNPSAAVVTTVSGLQVPANGVAMRATPYGDPNPLTVTGPLPSGATLTTLGVPASWLNPVTGLPYQLNFGWSGGTGSQNQNHAISNVTATTLLGELPVLGGSISDDLGGQVVAGNRASVTVTPTVASGSESQPVTVRTTMPAGLTPGTVTSSDWSCTTTAPTVACTHTPTTPTTTLPTFTIPVQVAANASAGTITSKISSIDAKATQVSHPYTVSTLAVTATPNPTTYGGQTTFAMTGVPAAVTSGQIAFSVNGSPACAAPLPATSCTATLTNPVGNHPLVAALTGSTELADQVAGSTVAVQPATAAVTAAPAQASVVYGQPNTITATVTDGATGTVTFSVDGEAVCEAVEITGTTAVCEVPSMPAGTVTVDVAYAGDANHTSANTQTTYEVSQITSTVTAAPAQASVVYGQPNTITATVTDGATGTVTFSVDGEAVCEAVEITGTTAVCEVPSMPAGTVTVDVAYSGDANHTSANTQTSYEVNQITSTVTAAPAQASVVYGQPNTITATVTDGATGTVTFSVDGEAVCEAVEITGTTAVCEVPSMPAGTVTVDVAYSGDANHTSANTQTSYEVTQATPTLAAEPDDPTVQSGLTPTVRAMVPGDATGSVTFTVAGDAVCDEVPVTAGEAVCDLPASLPVGPVNVEVSYSGDANYTSAVTSVALQVTPPPGPTVAVTGTNKALYVRHDGDTTWTNLSGELIAAPSVAVVTSGAGHVTQYIGIGTNSMLYQRTDTTLWRRLTTLDYKCTQVAVALDPTSTTVVGTCTAGNYALYTFSFDGSQTAPTVTTLHKRTADNQAKTQGSIGWNLPGAPAGPSVIFKGPGTSLGDTYIVSGLTGTAVSHYRHSSTNGPGTSPGGRYQAYQHGGQMMTIFTPTTHYDIGCGSVGNPAIVENPDGTAELYVTGLNGKTYTRHLTDSASPGGWTIIDGATVYGTSAAQVAPIAD
jgi:hypothetical protein